ncbi:hypothetical protein [Halorubrum sp. Hd13]|uniref:hypothetical protein n=1 Tax=Halorubrum sp. Hd13 TaxID=1480728 RepID=UPI0020164EAA|nr:hypothetical protein [Halorubrum sp. Hd13]
MPIPDLSEVYSTLDGISQEDIIPIHEVGDQVTQTAYSEEIANKRIEANKEVEYPWVAERKPYDETTSTPEGSHTSERRYDSDIENSTVSVNKKYKSLSSSAGGESSPGIEADSSQDQTPSGLIENTADEDHQGPDGSNGSIVAGIIVLAILSAILWATLQIVQWIIGFLL